MTVTPGYLVATYNTTASVANAYTYNTISGLANYTVQTGDILVYGVNWQSGPSTNLQIGLDFINSAGTVLRGSGLSDQNGLGVHPNTDISSFATKTWYDRSISLSSFVGTTITSWWLVGESDTYPGTCVGWYREIKVIDGSSGATRFTIYSNTDPTNTSPTAPSTNTSTGPQNAETLFSLTAVAAQNVASNTSNGSYYVRDFEAGTIWPEFTATNCAPTIVADGPGTVSQVNAGQPDISYTTTSKNLTKSLFSKSHGNSDYSYIDLSITLGASGIVRYRRNVQSESGYDFFRFRIDTVVQEAISGSPGWVQSADFSLSAGTHLLRWEFTTDASVSVGFSGYHLTDIEISNTNPNPSFTVVSTGGGSGGGSGNMLGSLFLGETMLGGDPGPSTGDGNGYGNTSNMLGIFMLGEPMLGADPSNGSGTSVTVAITGSVYQLTPAVIASRATVTAIIREALLMRPSAITGRTTITGNLTQSSLRGKTSAGSTNVTANLSTAGFFSSTTINTRTTVAGTLGKKIPTLQATPVNGTTTVSGSLTRSTLKAQNIYSSMYVAGSLAMRQALKPEAVRDSTTVTGAGIGIANNFSQGEQSTGRTTVAANLTKLLPLSGGQVIGQTTVSGSLTRSYLRGAISGSTAVTGSTLKVKSAYSGTITTTTKVKCFEGEFKRILRPLVSTDVQTISAGTTVRGRVYVLPRDFVPININTSTRVQGNLVLKISFGSTSLTNRVIGKTTVTASLTGLQQLVGIIHGKTTVVGKARAGFGGEVHGFGFVNASMAVKFPFANVHIYGRTTVVAAAPKNGFAATIWGGTRFALTYGTPDYVLGFYVIDGINNYNPNNNYQLYFQPHNPSIRLGIYAQGTKITGGTRLRTLIIPSRAWAHNQKGNPPYYGPYGSVSLLTSPKGDIGNGDFIDCQTVVGANMLALRHRLMVLLSAVGLEFPGQLSFTGDAVRGSGTKMVTGGTVALKQIAERAPVSQTAYYV